VSFLDKLHRNETARDVRPEAELQKLFGKGKNKLREREREQDEQQNEGASERLVNVALNGAFNNPINTAAKAIVGGSDPIAPIAMGTQVSEKVNELGSRVQGAITDPMNAATDVVGMVNPDLKRTSKKKQAQQQQEQEATEDEAQQQDDWGARQRAENSRLQRDRNGGEEQQEQEQEAQDESPQSEQQSKKKKLGKKLLTKLADKLIPEVDAKVGGFNVHLEAKPDFEGKKPALKANASASGHGFNGELSTDNALAKKPEVAANASYENGPVHAHASTENVLADKPVIDASAGVTGQVGPVEVTADVGTPDLLAKKKQVDARLSAKAFGKGVEKDVPLVAPGEETETEQGGGRLEAMHEAMHQENEQQEDEATEEKARKKGGQRLTKLALDNAEEKETESEDKIEAADQLTSKKTKEQQKAKDGTDEKNDKDGAKAKNENESPEDDGEDENQDKKHLPGKVGAVSKLAKQELEHHGKDSTKFAEDSKKKLQQKTVDGHGTGVDVDEKHDKKALKVDGHGTGVDIDGKQKPKQLSTKDDHGEHKKLPQDLDLDGDGKPDKAAKNHELEHHGLLNHEDEEGEVQDADGQSVPYSPMKSKGAPAPKASKGSQPGGHAKPPEPPGIPENLTSKNQQGINAYIAQAKRDRDAAKAKVQTQQLAKSQSVQVDAKALAAQVKQKNDQRLATLRQQADAKKAKAEQEAKEKLAKEGPVTLESLKEKLETTATADKQKLTDTYNTKKTELSERLKTQKETLEAEAKKQVENLTKQQAEKKKAAEEAWTREKKTLTENKDKLLTQVRKQTEADQARLTNDRDKIIAATNTKVEKLTKDNQANYDKTIADGKTKGDGLQKQAYDSAAAHRSRAAGEAQSLRNQAAAEQDEGKKASLNSQASGVVSSAATRAGQLEAKGRMDNVAAQKAAQAAANTAKDRGQAAIESLKKTQESQITGIQTKITELNGLADSKIAKAEQDLNAKLAAGDQKIKTLIDETATKIAKLREETNGKIAKLETDGVAKLEKDYNAAIAAIDKRVEAARKQLAQGNEKNLKALEKMVNDTCKALDKQVVDTEKKFDSTILDAEKKAQAFVLAQLHKIKAEADKALKAIDDEFAAAMKRLDDTVKQTQDSIDETAKGKMLEIEVHTATLLADIGEGSRLDAAKQQLEWYIKNKQPIPAGYGEKAPEPVNPTQKISDEEKAKKDAADPTKKDETVPAEKKPDNAFDAAELAAAEEKKKLLDPNDLSPEGIAAKVEDQLKKGQSETARAKADDAATTIDREGRRAAWTMQEVVKTKTAEQVQVLEGNKDEIDKVVKFQNAEQAGRDGAKEISEALKKTNWYGGKKPDKAAIMKALEGKDETAIAMMKAELAKQGIDLEAMLKEELSGGQQEEALVRLQGDPMMGDLVALKNAKGHQLSQNQQMAMAATGAFGLIALSITGETIGEDKARMRELLEKYKAEGRLDEFAEKYEKMTGQSLRHLLSITESQDLAKDLGEKYVAGKDPGSREQTQKDIDRIYQELKSDPEKAKNCDAGKAESSARDIIEALGGLHLDSTRAEMVNNALKGRTKEEIELIKALYKSKTGLDMDMSMQRNLTGSALLEARALSSGDKTSAAVARIMGSEDASWTPWTVDDKKMQEALKELKDPAERRAVLEAYEKRTGKKLQDVIVEKMTGNDEKLALALSEGDAVKARAIELDEATNGGWMNGMHKAIAERTGINTEPYTRGVVNQLVAGPFLPVGHVMAWVAPEAKLTIGGYTIENGAIHKVDSDKIFQLLEETPNPADRERLKALYKQQTGRELDDDMSKTLPGLTDKSRLDAYNAIQEGRMDDYYAARMDDAVSGLNDSKAFHAQLEGKPEWQRKQILDAWKKRHPNESFDEMLNGQFGADSLDKQKAQMLAGGKDDPATGAVKLPDEFVLKYAQDSVWSRAAKTIDSQLGFVEKYPFLMMVPGISHAKTASYFMRGWGVDSDAIKNTLKGKSKAELEELRKKYPELDKDLGYVLSGRDLYEVQLQLKEGEPQTDEEKIKRRLAMLEFDRGEGGSWIPGLGLSKISNGITDLISPSGQLLDQDKEFLLKQLSVLQSGQELPPEVRMQLSATMAGMETSTKNFMEQRAAVTEAIATAVGVVVGAVVTVLTGGVAGAILAALATGAATIGTKMVMLGQSYGRNEMGVDIAMTAVQMATAGLGGGISKMSQSFLTQVLNGAIGNAASSFVQTAITSKDAHDLLGLLAQATKSGLVGFVSGGAGAAVTAQLQDVMGKLAPKAFGENASLGGIFVRGFVTGSGGAAASMFVEAMADPSMLSGNWDQVLWNMTNTIVIQGGLSNAISETAEGYGDKRRAHAEQQALAKKATDAAKEVKARGGSLDDQQAAFAKVMGDGVAHAQQQDAAQAQKKEDEARDPSKAAEKHEKTPAANDNNKVAQDNDPTQATQKVDPATQKVTDSKTLGDVVSDIDKAAAKPKTDDKPAAPQEEQAAGKQIAKEPKAENDFGDVMPADPVKAKTDDAASGWKEPKADANIGSDEASHKAKVDERKKALLDSNPGMTDKEATRRARNEVLYDIQDATPGPLAKATTDFSDAVKAGDGNAAVKALEGVTDLQKAKQLVQELRQANGNKPLADILSTLPADQQVAVKKHLDGLQANPEQVKHAQSLLDAQAKAHAEYEAARGTANEEAAQKKLAAARQEAIDAVMDAYGIDDTTVAQRMATDKMGYGIERGSVGVSGTPGGNAVAEALPSGHVVAKNMGNDLFLGPDGKPVSPGFLASALAHEVEIHIDQQLHGDKYTINAKKGAVDTGTAINEAQAYKHMVDNAARFGLNESEVAWAQKRLDEHMQVLAKNDPAAFDRAKKGDFSTPGHDVQKTPLEPWTIHGGDKPADANASGKQIAKDAPLTDAQKAQQTELALAQLQLEAAQKAKDPNAIALAEHRIKKAQGEQVPVLDPYKNISPADREHLIQLETSKMMMDGVPADKARAAAEQRVHDQLMADAMRQGDDHRAHEKHEKREQKLGVIGGTGDEIAGNLLAGTPGTAMPEQLSHYKVGADALSVMNAIAEYRKAGSVQNMSSKALAEGVVAGFGQALENGLKLAHMHAPAEWVGHVMDILKYQAMAADPQLMDKMGDVMKAVARKDIRAAAEMTAAITGVKLDLESARNKALITDLLAPTVHRPMDQQTHEAAKFEYEIERSALRSDVDKKKIALDKLETDHADYAKAKKAYEGAVAKLADMDNTVADREARRAEWQSAKTARDKEIELATLELDIARSAKDPLAIERAEHRLKKAESAPILAVAPGSDPMSKVAVSTLANADTPEQRAQLAAAMRQVHSDVRGRTPAELAADPAAMKAFIDLHVALRENILQDGNHVSKVIGPDAMEKMLAGQDFRGNATNDQTTTGFIGDQRNLTHMTPHEVVKFLGLDYDDKTYVRGPHGEMQGVDSLILLDMPVTDANKAMFADKGRIPMDPDLVHRIRELARNGDPQAQKLLPQIRSHELNWGDAKNPYAGFGMSANGSRMGKRHDGLSLNQEMEATPFSIPDGSRLKIKTASGEEVVIAHYEVKTDPVTGEKKGRFVLDETAAARAKERGLAPDGMEFKTPAEVRAAFERGDFGGGGKEPPKGPDAISSHEPPRKTPRELAQDAQKLANQDREASTTPAMRAKFDEIDQLAALATSAADWEYIRQLEHKANRPVSERFSHNDAEAAMQLQIKQKGKDSVSPEQRAAVEAEVKAKREAHNKAIEELTAEVNFSVMKKDEQVTQRVADEANKTESVNGRKEISVEAAISLGVGGAGAAGAKGDKNGEMPLGVARKDRIGIQDGTKQELWNTLGHKSMGQEGDAISYGLDGIRTGDISEHKTAMPAKASEMALQVAAQRDESGIGTVSSLGPVGPLEYKKVIVNGKEVLEVGVPTRMITGKDADGKPIIEVVLIKTTQGVDVSTGMGQARELSTEDRGDRKAQMTKEDANKLKEKKQMMSGEQALATDATEFKGERVLGIGGGPTSVWAMEHALSGGAKSAEIAGQMPRPKGGDLEKRLNKVEAEIRALVMADKPVPAELTKRHHEIITEHVSGQRSRVAELDGKLADTTLKGRAREKAQQERNRIAAELDPFMGSRVDRNNQMLNSDKMVAVQADVLRVKPIQEDGGHWAVEVTYADGTTRVVDRVIPSIGADPDAPGGIHQVLKNAPADMKLVPVISEGRVVGLESEPAGISISGAAMTGTLGTNMPAEILKRIPADMRDAVVASLIEHANREGVSAGSKGIIPGIENVGANTQLTIDAIKNIPPDQRSAELNAFLKKHDNRRKAEFGGEKQFPELLPKSGSLADRLDKIDGLELQARSGSEAERAEAAEKLAKLKNDPEWQDAWKARDIAGDTLPITERESAPGVAKVLQEQNPDRKHEIHLGDTKATAPTEHEAKIRGELNELNELRLKLEGLERSKTGTPDELKALKDDIKKRQDGLDDLIKDDANREALLDPHVAFALAREANAGDRSQLLHDFLRDNVDAFRAAQDQARQGNDPVLRAKREVFEREIAKLVLGDPKTKKRVDDNLDLMCKKAMDYLGKSRSSEQMDAALAELGAHWGDGYAGAVLTEKINKDKNGNVTDSPEEVARKNKVNADTMREVLAGGNVRERMIALGKFADLVAKDMVHNKEGFEAVKSKSSDEAGTFSAKDVEAYQERMKQFLADRGWKEGDKLPDTKDFLKPTKDEKSGSKKDYQNAKKQEMDTKIPSLSGDPTHAAQASSDFFESGTLPAHKDGMTGMGEKSTLARTDITIEEAERMGYKLSDREREIAKKNGGKLPWVVGTIANVVDPSSKFIQKGAEHSLPQKAGISGTTFRFMEAAQMLGGDAQMSRLAMIGALQTIDAHTVYEIASASKDFGGLQFDPTRPYDHLGLDKETLQELATRTGTTLAELNGPEKPKSDETTGKP